VEHVPRGPRFGSSTHIRGQLDVGCQIRWDAIDIAWYRSL
jgi:hypothetical protein